MAGVVKFCPECRKAKVAPFNGYYPFMTEDAVCNAHNITMITLNISHDEYVVFVSVSGNNPDFIDAMVKLKDQDPIEYERKMGIYQKMYAQTQKSVSKKTPSRFYSLPKSTINTIYFLVIVTIICWLCALGGAITLLTPAMTFTLLLLFFYFVLK